MTNEEAIKNIKEHCYFANLIPQAKEALDMAIKALEQEPCDDCVSRQAMLEIQAKYAEYVGATKFWQMRDEIKALPPVTPQKKTGHWIQEEVRGSLQNRCSITRKEIEELKEMIDKQPYSFLLINPKQKEYEKVLRENRINIDICWNVFCEEGKAYFIPYTEVTKPKFFFREDDDMYDKWQKYN